MTINHEALDEARKQEQDKERLIQSAIDRINAHNIERYNAQINYSLRAADRVLEPIWCGGIKYNDKHRPAGPVNGRTKK